jgi:DNA adenine methylase
MAEKVLLIEKDPYVASVWTVLIHGDYEKLANRILNFDLNINNVQEELSYPGTSSDDKAFQTILRNRVSHGGIMAPGSGFIKNGENGKGISSRWYPETLARRIRDIGLVRDKIKFIEGDAFAIIESYLDDPQTVFFVDPPYTAAGKRAGRRLYTHSGLDHDSLFDMFLDAKSDFLFTYDNSDDLIDMAKSRRFETKLIPMKNTHHAEMSELIVSRNLDWLTQ